MKKRRMKTAVVLAGMVVALLLLPNHAARSAAKAAEAEAPLAADVRNSLEQKIWNLLDDGSPST